MSLEELPEVRAPKFVVAFTPVAMPLVPESIEIAPEPESMFTAPSHSPQSVPTPVRFMAPLVEEIVVGVVPEP
jgi:hypothetical protein